MDQQILDILKMPSRAPISGLKDIIYTAINESLQQDIIEKDKEASVENLVLFDSIFNIHDTTMSYFTKLLNIETDESKKAGLRKLKLTNTALLFQLTSAIPVLTRIHGLDDHLFERAELISKSVASLARVLLLQDNELSKVSSDEILVRLAVMNIALLTCMKDYSTPEFENSMVIEDEMENIFQLVSYIQPSSFASLDVYLSQSFPELRGVGDGLIKCFQESINVNEGIWKRSTKSQNTGMSARLKDILSSYSSELNVKILSSHITTCHIIESTLLSKLTEDLLGKSTNFGIPKRILSDGLLTN